MVYFGMQDLIGKNSAEAYNYYLYQVEWLFNNIPLTDWSFDNSYKVCINGINIPCGLRFNNFESACKFSKDCL